MPAVYPPQLDYTQGADTLDLDSYTLNSSAVPTNGSSFAAGQIIFVDLPKQDFLIPDSLYIRYNTTVVTGTAAGFVAGCPVYTPFLKLEVICNGTNIETIPQYNLVQHMISNITLSKANKYALETAYGYTAAETGNECNGHLCAATTETYHVSAPLNCILSNCKKYIPLGAMPQIRLQFTLDAMSNMMGYSATSTNTSFTITNFEVAYEIYHAPAHVMHAVQSLDKIYLKSISFTSLAQSLPTGTSGLQSLNYNVRYNSIKAAFLIFSATAPGAIATNGQFDSFEITSNVANQTTWGDYQILIGNMAFPQKSLSVQNNRTGILSELRKAATTCGQFYSCIFDKANEMDIALANWQAVSYYTGTSTGASTLTATTQAAPSKFYVGIHTEKMHNNDNIFSGVSSRDSAIVARVNLPVATANVAVNAVLVLVFDTLIEIDMTNGQVAVKQ